MTGKIHSFESFGAADGPGVRFIVFLHGCPLRCMYCHNPDTWANDKSAMELMSDDILRVMAIELKEIVEEYATVDWSKKKDTRAKMRMQIKRLLKKYNYPPDFTEEAISRVVDQAEFMM